MEIIIPITLTIIGYLCAYFYKLILNQRQDRLTFVEKQINEFYGPLYVSTMVGRMMFDSLFQKRREKGMKFLSAPKSEKDISEWRIWVEQCFMPNNRKITSLILDKAHLIREQQVPKCLLDYSVHVAGYEAVIKKWEQGDFSQAISLFPFPQEINGYAEKSYLELKAEQLRLLGKTVKNITLPEIPKSPGEMMEKEEDISKGDTEKIDQKKEDDKKQEGDEEKDKPDKDDDKGDPKGSDDKDDEGEKEDKDKGGKKESKGKEGDDEEEEEKNSKDKKGKGKGKSKSKSKGKKNKTKKNKKK